MGYRAMILFFLILKDLIFFVSSLSTDFVRNEVSGRWENYDLLPFFCFLTISLDSLALNA